MLCSKCNKRPAVVFVSNSADGQSKGYCLTCAKELGIKPVEDRSWTCGYQIGEKTVFITEL